MSNYEIDLESGTVTLSYSGLNPQEMKELARKLETDSFFLSKSKANIDPIKVFLKSARRDISNGIITFYLSYNAPPIVGNLDEEIIPEPNVKLTEEQYERYCSLYRNMTS